MEKLYDYLPQQLVTFILVTLFSYSSVYPNGESA